MNDTNNNNNNNNNKNNMDNNNNNIMDNMNNNNNMNMNDMNMNDNIIFFKLIIAILIALAKAHQGGFVEVDPVSVSLLHQLQEPHFTLYWSRAPVVVE